MHLIHHRNAARWAGTSLVAVVLLAACSGAWGTRQEQPVVTATATTGAGNVVGPLLSGFTPTPGSRDIHLPFADGSVATVADGPHVHTVTVSTIAIHDDNLPIQVRTLSFRVDVSNVGPDPIALASGWVMMLRNGRPAPPLRPDPQPITLTAGESFAYPLAFAFAPPGEVPATIRYLPTPTASIAVSFDVPDAIAKPPMPAPTGTPNSNVTLASGMPTPVPTVTPPASTRPITIVPATATLPNVTPAPTVPPVAGIGTVECTATATGECFQQAFARCDLTQQAKITVARMSTDRSGNAVTQTNIFTIAPVGTACTIDVSGSYNIVQPNGGSGGAAIGGTCTHLTYDSASRVLRFRGCTGGDMDVTLPE